MLVSSRALDDSLARQHPAPQAIANGAAAVRSANDSMKVATAVQARRLSPLLYAERKNEVLAASNKLTSIYATAGAGADVTVWWDGLAFGWAPWREHFFQSL
jgi:hypothetical protein